MKQYREHTAPFETNGSPSLHDRDLLCFCFYQSQTDP